eukprot:362606-Chlamydomonas_euryale.AAC.9
MLRKSWAAPHCLKLPCREKVESRNSPPHACVVAYEPLVSKPTKRRRAAHSRMSLSASPGRRWHAVGDGGLSGDSDVAHSFFQPCFFRPSRNASSTRSTLAAVAL